MKEEQRLQAVRQFEQLNLADNRELQRTVAAAAKLCQVPIASLTLLDEETQWLKVSQGLEISRTPRKLSFCTHTIKHTGLLTISDTRLDPVFCRHPHVTDGHKIRFYAGAPLITHDGQRIGTLCAMDSQPHSLTAQQKLVFRLLTRHAVSVMELTLSLEQLDTSFTDLKQVRASKSGNEIKLRSMFESLTDSYYLLGRDGEMIDFNRTAYNFVETMFGEKLTYGRSMTDFLTKAYLDTFDLHYRNALNGKKILLERQADFGKKGKIWWECIFAPVKNDNGEVIGVSYVARNIDERKRNEEKILEQNRLLTRIAEIQSHDYRGPVATILGLMNLIETENYPPPREYLAMLQSAVKQLDKKIMEVVQVVNDPRISDNRVN